MHISIVHFRPLSFLSFFFFNDPPTTEIYTLSLHDALPISTPARPSPGPRPIEPLWHTRFAICPTKCAPRIPPDRKSTRLNSSHGYISYAVFCLKKKKKKGKLVCIHVQVYTRLYSLCDKSI